MCKKFQNFHGVESLFGTVLANFCSFFPEQQCLYRSKIKIQKQSAVATGLRYFPCLYSCLETSSELGQIVSVVVLKH